jgi:hypothetical protein
MPPPSMSRRWAMASAGLTSRPEDDRIGDQK